MAYGSEKSLWLRPGLVGYIAHEGRTVDEAGHKASSTLVSELPPLSRTSMMRPLAVERKVECVVEASLPTGDEKLS